MQEDHIRNIETARLKYKPGKISCLFIAEAPPSAEDRFFYFEDVNEQDSLYLEMMKILFSPEKSNKGVQDEDEFKFDFSLESLNGLSVSDLRDNKEEYLIRFKDKGYYLIDNLDFPMPNSINRTKDKINYLDKYKDSLCKKNSTVG